MDRLFEQLERVFSQWESTGATGDEAHREQLKRLAEELGYPQAGRVLFVCTHNSRRSQIAQVVGAAAAVRVGLPITCLSGGTEETSVALPAIEALRRVGFKIDLGRSGRFLVRSSPTSPAVEVFSKKTDSPSNAVGGGCVAVMVCSKADAECPSVAGATARISLPYDDPGAADGTPAEAERYSECVQIIGRDLTYVFNRAAGRSGCVQS